MPQDPPTAPTPSVPTTSRVPVGIPGLDAILRGGLLAGRSYLVRGGPGSGKTLLSLQFLEAADPEEGGLFISLGEDPGQIRADGQGLGLDLEHVDFLDLSPSAEFFAEDQSYEVFHPAEVEGGGVRTEITDRIERDPPARVVIDSMTHLQHLATSPAQFRKQAMGLLKYLSDQGATVVFTAEHSAESPDTALQFLSDGVLELVREAGWRTIEVHKFRGSDFQSGPHPARIQEGGMDVFPRLSAEVPDRTFTGEQLSSGVPEIDALLGGGLHRGTVTMITGASGVGKTTLGLQFMKEAAGRGERSLVYGFEEETETLIHRCESLNIPVRSMLEEEVLSIRPVRPGAMSAGEFAHQVLEEVESRATRMVLIDGLGPYQTSLQGSQMDTHLHLLLKHLTARGVTVLITDEVQSITGEFRPTSSAVSHLADNLIFLRYLEIGGQLKKAIGVLKKRAGQFETQLREFGLSEFGIKVGKPLTQLRGILSGVPEIDGSSDDPGMATTDAPRPNTTS